MSNALGRRVAILMTAALLIAGPLAGVAGAAPPDAADAVEIFATHVYEMSTGSLRNPTPQTDPNEPLYNVAGFNLGVTWGEWSGASAASRASTIGGPNGPRTDFRVSLRGLVPGGVYSLFYFTVEPDTEQPLCPGVERSLPLDAARPGAQLPDPNSFVVGPTGSTEFHGRVDGNLLAARQVVLAVVHHADGQTYYPFPNRGEFLTQGEACRSSFGHDAMRHLLVLQKW
jgi:hypothetical protein